MTGTVITGAHLTGVTLNNPSTENPATVTASGYITNTTTAHGGDAIYGLAGIAWTVINFGTVESAAADGINLQANGSVINGSRRSTIALISGSQHGVVIRGGGTVTNFGTIESTGTGNTVGLFTYNAAGSISNSGTIRGGADGHGIYLDNGGRITNGSEASTTALIEGGNGLTSSDFGGAATVTNFGAVVGTGFAGVWIEDGGTVSNFGTVKNTGTAFYGVDLLAGGKLINGSNSKTAALIEGGIDGILVEGTGTITNFGTIEGIGKASPAPSSTQGAGIYLDGGGIANFGAIRGIGANSFGIVLGAGGRVTNGRSGSDEGLIIAPNKAVAIYDGNGKVTNFGTIGGTGDAVLLDGAAGSSPVFGGNVTNFGRIETTGTAALAIDLEGGGKVTNGSSGSTAALIKAGTNAILANLGAGTVTNFGTIEDAPARLAGEAITMWSSLFRGAGAPPMLRQIEREGQR